MSAITLLGISGSLRKASLNTLLMREAARLFDPDIFVEGDLNLPLYDGDLEEANGIPAPVAKLAEQIAHADAVVISGPEYNKAISGVLKNALDWISRTKPNPWAGKPVAIMSATGGRAGGELTQATLRHCLTPFNPRLLYGPGVWVAAAAQQFDENGRLTNEFNAKALTTLMEALRAEIPT